MKCVFEGRCLRLRAVKSGSKGRSTSLLPNREGIGMVQVFVSQLTESTCKRSKEGGDGDSLPYG
jgi:hypothetical protein